MVLKPDWTSRFDRRSVTILVQSCQRFPPNCLVQFFFPPLSLFPSTGPPPPLQSHPYWKSSSCPSEPSRQPCWNPPCPRAGKAFPAGPPPSLQSHPVTPLEHHHPPCACSFCLSEPPRQPCWNPPCPRVGKALLAGPSLPLQSHSRDPTGTPSPLACARAWKSSSCLPEPPRAGNHPPSLCWNPLPWKS